MKASKASALSGQQGPGSVDVGEAKGRVGCRVRMVEVEAAVVNAELHEVVADHEPDDGIESGRGGRVEVRLEMLAQMDKRHGAHLTCKCPGVQ
jgi:hypothetical protein